MTAKQERFVEEYLIDLNATKAAIRAGYSVKSASKIGSELLQKTGVKVAIEKAMAERSRRIGIHQDRVLQELAKIAFVNAPDVINIDEATIQDGAERDDTAAILSVRVKKTSGDGFETVEREIKLADKLRALEMIGKHLGMWTEKKQIEVEGTGVVMLPPIMEEADDDADGEGNAE